jgi:hypothetical protein
MLKKLGPAGFGGDDNVCELSRVCPTCEGTSLVPPRLGHMVTQGASNPCTACKTGLLVQRFKTVNDLKTFVATL